MPRAPRAEYMRVYRERRRAEAIAALGGVCVRCGTDQDLEFDHIDPATKSFTISGFSQSKAALAKELAKCQLLCTDHHLEKTASENMSEVCFRGHIKQVAPTGKRYCQTCTYQYKTAWRQRRRALGLPVT